MNAIELGKRLQKARQEASLDIWSVAHKLGIHYTQIRAYESGSKQITFASLIELSQLYGLNDLKWAFSEDLGELASIPMAIPLVTPQIESDNNGRPYDLTRDQITYLSALHWGLPSIGQALMVVDYLALVDLELIENEALTAHGDWYCEQHLEREATS